MEIRKRDSKTLREITREWDDIAPVRIRQLQSGKDITFDEVLSPGVLTLAADLRGDYLLDAGCGVGVLTHSLSAQFISVSGVDPSPKSIEIARENFGRECNFYAETLEDFASYNKKKFDCIVANMVLMDVLDLKNFLSSVRNLMRVDGGFIFSFPHPFYWPEYYGYDNFSWFDYTKEIIIESPFRISNQPDLDLISTHIHRPIGMYISAFFEAGLSIEILNEPVPSGFVQARYPRPWSGPRYLLGRARRIGRKY